MNVEVPEQQASSLCEGGDSGGQFATSFHDMWTLHAAGPNESLKGRLRPGPGMGSRPRIEYGAGWPRERRLCAQVVGPARPGWAAGRVQTQTLNRLGLGMPASRILSVGRFTQMLSPLGVVPGSRERRRLGRSRLRTDLGCAGAYSQMYLPYESGTSPEIQ